MVCVQLLLREGCRQLAPLQQPVVQQAVVCGRMYGCEYQRRDQLGSKRLSAA